MLSTLVALTALQVAPPLRVRDDAGRARLVKPTTRPLLLSFWATWCPPCREELPRLAEAARGGRVQVLAVNYGESPAQVRAYLKRAGLGALPVAFAGPAELNAWPLPGLPASALVDTRGALKAVQYGPLGAAQLKRWLDALPR
ncbi:TlpA family protein disulfide reductase [Deinococcus maricopensis]|uniref:Alkyl hydroperoxide reductase/ Thiol specific antioxidant/ Mal allergen n=1 Tax=Deinococcus maricopensis (strain DSM 21211 / LMG 22137 / NRRL B-23946 / LB-34) TaxID=709986 RepID=E8U887_DEIML|nr:TlpA disulfide reductase family protein [Deinococcus maricopensis]ADV67276.1 alkyl hydroperoxide reductase/ Thiol specific antioxidant/ Mal allergen [Deinococcus maricopensis DSM 21211]